MVKTAPAVEEHEVPGRLQIRVGQVVRPPGGSERTDGDFGAAAPLHLVLERTAFVKQDDAGDGEEQGAILLRHLFVAPHKDTAGFVQQAGFGAGADEVVDGVLKVLSVDGVIFIQDHQIDSNALETPVGMHCTTCPTMSRRARSRTCTSRMGRSPEIP